MPSPFPGTNPSLEQDACWQDFHLEFLPAIRARLVAQSRPKYIVVLDEHPYVRELPSDRRRLVGRADDSMAAAHERRTGNAAGLGVLEAPTREVLHQVYDAAGYDDFIYAGKPAPRLSFRDAAWARTRNVQVVRTGAIQMKKHDVDRWLRQVRAPMPFESYQRLPRHPAYQFEYWDGQLRISPRWQSHNMFLELRPPEVNIEDDRVAIASTRPLVSSDWDVLPEVLAVAFRDSPPFGFLGIRRRRWAARDWLCATRDGEEGPLVDSASFVAVDREDSALILGALIVTVMTGWPRSWYAARRAAMPPAPPDLAEGREQPQICWVFVRPRSAVQGVATALLTQATNALWHSGFRELASATTRGNDSSMAWHWRRGFRLLPDRKPVPPRR